MTFTSYNFSSQLDVRFLKSLPTLLDFTKISRKRSCYLNCTTCLNSAIFNPMSSKDLKKILLQKKLDATKSSKLHTYTTIWPSLYIG